MVCGIVYVSCSCAATVRAWISNESYQYEKLESVSMGRLLCDMLVLSVILLVSELCSVVLVCVRQIGGGRLFVLCDVAVRFVVLEVYCLRFWGSGGTDRAQWSVVPITCDSLNSDATDLRGSGWPSAVLAA